MAGIKYKGSPREYTVFGISPVFKEIVDKEFIDYFGGKSLSNLYFVVRDGTFYHFQVDEEVGVLIKAFLSRVSRGEIDLNDVYIEYDASVSRLEDIYKRGEQDYSFQTLMDFYALYPKFIKVAYSSFYSADFVSEVIKDETKAQEFLEWITKIRKRGENIYKYGENVFIPAYSKWLSKKIPGGYFLEQVQSLTHLEITAFIERSESLPSKEVLADRKKIFFGHYKPVGQESYLSGTDALQKIQELGLFKEIDARVEMVDTFNGQAAFKGKVSGRVRLVFKREDMGKFKDGEIIVSPMTEPGYIPIMRKALGFITDEGGLLCHAAIVSREMRKPCVIGTKIATRILKDGDMVELDATNGVVRIIKRV